MADNNLEISFFLFVSQFFFVEGILAGRTVSDCIESDNEVLIEKPIIEVNHSPVPWRSKAHVKGK